MREATGRMGYLNNRRDKEISHITGWRFREFRMGRTNAGYKCAKS